MEKILLKHDHITDIRQIDVYEKHGGYQVAKNVLAEMSPDQVVEEVKISGLRGRGGAGFPTGLKWTFLAKPENTPRYLICNADESEPGTFKDRYLMERNPHLLLEGLIISSYALGADICYIYVRGEFFYLIEILEQAIMAAVKKGYIGEGIFGRNVSLQIHVHPGAGAYICGEETALLESLEGKRGLPRSKPPFPAVHGLYNCPTIINNVETLAAVVPILAKGGAAYAKIGVGKSTGSKLFSASGHIKKPGVYEVELGLPVKEFVYSNEYCGGMLNEKSELKAVVVGGSSVPILPKKLAFETKEGKERLLTYESLAEGGFESGTMLGSGGFIVIDNDTNIVDNLYTFARFYSHESCGQCSPCREGTGWMERILYRFVKRIATKEEIELLWTIQSGIEGKTICPFGEAAAWPVASAIRHFRKDFEACLQPRKTALSVEQKTA